MTSENRHEQDTSKMKRRITYPRWLLLVFALFFIQICMLFGIWWIEGVLWVEGLPLALRFIPAYEVAAALSLTYVANRLRQYDRQ